MSRPAIWLRAVFLLAIGLLSAPVLAGPAPNTGKLTLPELLPLLPPTNKPITTPYWQPTVRAATGQVSIQAPRRIRLQVGEQRQIPVTIYNARRSAITIKIEPWAPSHCSVGGLQATLPKGARRTFLLPFRTWLAQDHYFYLRFSFHSRVVSMPIDVHMEDSYPLFGVQEYFELKSAQEKSAVQDLQYLQSLPVQVLSLEIPWAEVEPQPGEYHWAGLDRLLGRVREVGGYRILAEVGSPPAWVQPFPSPPDEKKMAAYAQFLRQAVMRYQGQVDSWGIWRESRRKGDQAGSWVNLISSGSAVIRRHDPSALVIVPGWGKVGAVGLDFDVLGQAISYRIEKGRDAMAWAEFDRAMSLADLIRTMEQNRVAGQVWVTKFGFSPEHLAPLACLRACSIWASQGARAMVASGFYDYAGLSSDLGITYLVRHRSKEKTLLFDVYQCLIESLSGSLPDPSWVTLSCAEIGDRLQIGDPATALSFRRGQELILCIWSNHPAPLTIGITFFEGLSLRSSVSLSLGDRSLRHHRFPQPASASLSLALQPLEFRILRFEP